MICKHSRVACLDCGHELDFIVDILEQQIEDGEEEIRRLTEPHNQGGYYTLTKEQFATLEEDDEVLWRDSSRGIWWKRRIWLTDVDGEHVEPKMCLAPTYLEGCQDIYCDDIMVDENVYDEIIYERMRNSEEEEEEEESDCSLKQMSSEFFDAHFDFLN